MPAIGDARILIMATDGFEESELFGPREILMGKGAEVRLASPSLTPDPGDGPRRSGQDHPPDLTIADAKPRIMTRCCCPAGCAIPTRCASTQAAVALIRAFADAGKPVAAICHGPWLLVEADVVRGRRVTSWPSIRTDLRNAGAEVVDEAAVTDGNIVTSRKPDDVAAFTDALIEL